MVLGHPTIDDFVSLFEPFQALFVYTAAGCRFIQKESVVVKLSFGLLASIGTCLVPGSLLEGCLQPGLSWQVAGACPSKHLLKEQATPHPSLL